MKCKKLREKLILAFHIPTTLFNLFIIKLGLEGFLSFSIVRTINPILKITQSHNKKFNGK